MLKEKDVKEVSKGRARTVGNVTCQSAEHHVMLINSNHLLIFVSATNVTRNVTILTMHISPGLFNSQITCDLVIIVGM